MASFSGHKQRVFALDYLPTNDQLYSAGEDGTLRVWDAKVIKIKWTGECLTFLLNFFLDWKTNPISWAAWN